MKPANAQSTESAVVHGEKLKKTRRRKIGALAATAVLALSVVLATTSAEVAEVANLVYGTQFPWSKADSTSPRQASGLAVSMAAAEVEIAKISLGKDHLGVAQLENTLAALLASRGQFKKAEEVLTEALAIRRKALGDKHPYVVESLISLAKIESAQGDYESSEHHLREAIEIQRQLRPDQQVNLFQNCVNLSFLMVLNKQYAEAVQYCKELVTVFGANHPELPIAINNLGNLSLSQSNSGSAKELLSMSVPLMEKSDKPDRKRIAITKQTLSQIAMNSQDMNTAEQLLNESLALYKQSPPDVLGQAQVMNNLGCIYTAQRKYKEAETYLQQAIEIRRKAGAEERRSLYQSLQNYAVLLEKIGQKDQAERLRREAASYEI